jgi:hypothetical protein
MTAVTLLSLFPRPEDVLALAPENFGGIIIELMPPLLQNGMFNPAALPEKTTARQDQARQAGTRDGAGNI